MPPTRSVDLDGVRGTLLSDSAADDGPYTSAPSSSEIDAGWIMSVRRQRERRPPRCDNDDDEIQVDDNVDER